VQMHQLVVHLVHFILFIAIETSSHYIHPLFVRPKCECLGSKAIWQSALSAFLAVLEINDTSHVLFKNSIASSSQSFIVGFGWVRMMPYAPCYS
jgi:hypothetical protein